MTFWQENYAFIKDVYDMRHQKMAEWMENVEKVRKIMPNCHSVMFCQLCHKTITLVIFSLKMQSPSLTVNAFPFFVSCGNFFHSLFVVNNSNLQNLGQI